jgi:chitosanase
LKVISFKLRTDCNSNIINTIYLTIARMKACHGFGQSRECGKCAFYDCIIQHGNDGDPDSIGAIISRTENEEGGPVDGNENDWIRQFFEIRRADLLNPDNELTKDEWSQSVHRVDAMEKLLDEASLDLSESISIESLNNSATIS